jgi:hypothetical protein
MSDFDIAFKKLVEEQRRTATGQRLEMLSKDLTGTRKLLESTLWPILKSLDGIVLEKEMVSLSGVKIYVDVFYEPLGIAFECDGYVAHGENLTRDRFSFERMRIRSVAVRGYRYFPFSYDEVDKKPEACQRAIYELMGRYASAPGSALMELPVLEREIVRLGWSKGGEPFTLAEACRCLLFKDDATRVILKKMVKKGILSPVGSGTLRHHAYQLTQAADALMV